MAKEIERKFRLDLAPAWLSADDGEEIEQGYLAFDARSEVRLRRRGDELTLTVKRGRWESRDEFEVHLDRRLFDRLWAATAGRRLTKRRALVALGDDLQAEVDVYAGRLEGLVVVEVEFGAESASREFEPPPWFGEEVTGDQRFANRSLALASRAPEIGGREDGKQSTMGTAFRLEEEVPAAGLRRIVAGRERKAGERLRRAARGEQVAASIHGARKDLKKLRAVLRLVRDQLGEKHYRRENERYREAGRALGAMRDAQAKEEALGSLLEGAELDASTRLIADGWRRTLAQEREAATAGAVADSEATIGPALELLESADPTGDLPLDPEASWSLVAAGLDRTYRRGRRAMAEAERGDPEAIHRWRKRAKDLRYQLRVLRPIWPEAMEAAADRGRTLTDLLGAHHDLTVLAEDLGRRDLPRSEAIDLEVVLRARQHQLLDDALDLGRRLYVEKPKAFRRRIHGYWKLWDPPLG